MYKTADFVFYVTVMCFVCVPIATTASTTFTINKRTYTQDDQCLVDLRVEGNDVNYTTTEFCADVDDLKLRYFPGGLVLGNHRIDPLCVYTDTARELVVIKNSTCVNVTRRAEGNQEETMAPPECAAAKSKVEEAWKRIVHVGVMENNIGVVNLVRRRYIQRGACTQELQLRVNETDTSLGMSCEQAEGLEVLHTPQGLVLGDHREDEVCVLASATAGLVVIQGSDRTCRRQFTSGEAVAVEQCEEAKRVVETLWDNNRKDFNITRRVKYTKKNRCVEEFAFAGQGVDASIKVKCEVGQKLDVLKLDEGFVIGDYRYSPICIFSESPTSLVAIKEVDGYKICREDVFQEEVSRRTLLPFDCAEAKQFVKERWDAATGKGASSVITQQSK